MLGALEGVLQIGVCGENTKSSLVNLILRKSILNYFNYLRAGAFVAFKGIV